MGQKSMELATRFEQVNQELIAFVEACSDANWRRTTTAEQWPVAVVAHHVGSSHGVIAGLARKIADGEALPPVSWDMIHSMNAQHAQEHANATKAETLGLLRQGGADAATMVRGLSDEQLARTGSVLGQPMTAAHLIDGILIGHVVEHAGSLRSALGRS